MAVDSFIPDVWSAELLTTHGAVSAEAALALARGAAGFGATWGIAESGIAGDDVVVEDGPGLGSLTLALLEVARRVIAIEVDPLPI